MVRYSAVASYSIHIVHVDNTTTDNYTSILLPFGNGTSDFYGPIGDDSASDPLMLDEVFTFFGNQYRKIIVRMHDAVSALRYNYSI